MSTKRILEKSKLAVALTILLGSVNTHAAELIMNGFLSFTGGMTLDEGDTYLVDPINDASYDSTFRWNRESLVGLQATSIINEKVRAVVQMKSKAYNTWDAEINWAYVNYTINEELSLTAGRFALPIYFYSDFVDVRYAYNWVRPPIDVYHVPVDNIEGLSLFYNKLIGDDIQLSMQGWWAGGDEQVNETTYVDVQDDMGLNVTLNWSGVTLRAVKSKADRTISFSTPAPDQNIAIEFQALALNMDLGNYIWRSELTDYEFGELEDVRSWYASTGYTFGSVTPMVTLSGWDGHSNLETESKTFTLAWRMLQSTSLKAEYSFREETPLDAPNNTNEVRLLAVSLDIVF